MKTDMAQFPQMAVLAEGSLKPRMLLVEDDPEIRGLLRNALCSDFEVVEAEDGADALSAVAQSVKTRSFDVMVVDVAMRHIDGFTLTRALRCFEKHEVLKSEAQILYHTAHPDLVGNSGLLKRMGIKPEDCYIKPEGTTRLLDDLRVMAREH
jgi:CheY-like chemotaxis protein